MPPAVMRAMPIDSPVSTLMSSSPPDSCMSVMEVRTAGSGVGVQPAPLIPPGSGVPSTSMSRRRSEPDIRVLVPAPPASVMPSSGQPSRQNGTRVVRVDSPSGKGPT